MHAQIFRNLTSKKLLLIASFVFAIFASISCSLVLTNINLPWMLKIHSNPILPELFWAVTNLGGDAFIALLILLLVERQPGLITSWVFKTWLSGALIAQIVKNIFPMPRPGFVIGLDQLSLIDNPPLVSGSMPSGHSLAAVSAGLILCAFVFHQKKKVMALFAIAFASALAAWARVAVGAHWPSDVVAGAALAVLVVTSALIWERHHSWNNWFQEKMGGVFLILTYLLISVHLTLNQSEFFCVRMIQFGLCCISLFKVSVLVKWHFFESSNLLETKR